MDHSRETLEQEYETVNEGDTTDTTSGVDDEALLAGTKKLSSNSIEDIKKAQAKTVEEGIKSSDEDEELAAAVENADADERVTVEQAARDEETAKLLAHSEADLN